MRKLGPVYTCLPEAKNMEIKLRTIEI